MRVCVCVCVCVMRVCFHLESVEVLPNSTISSVSFDEGKVKVTTQSGKEVRTYILRFLWWYMFVHTRTRTCTVGVKKKCLYYVTQ